MATGPLGKTLDRLNLFLTQKDLKRYVPFTGNLTIRRPSYYAIGQQFLELFKEPGGLEPGDRVLDIGCGPGRMAFALTDYLDEGSYAGMDVMKSCVRGCEKRLGGHPGFTFARMDVFNSRYNRHGASKACEYTFPFDDGSFDFVILTSVFTHLLAHDTFHYLQEISRLLAVDGTCFATFFLYDEERLARARDREKGLKFPFKGDGVLIEMENQPEYAVAYPEEEVLKRAGACGLEPRAIMPGRWDGSTGRTEYQDIVVFGK